MTEKITKSLLELYRIVSEKSGASLDSVRQHFLEMKVYEPMIQSSSVFGKVPSNRHILEDDIEEAPFQLNLK